MYHHLHYRVDHHHAYDHLIQSCQMRYMNHFESCMMYQKLEILQDFIHCVIGDEERAPVLLDDMESNDFFVCELFFHLVSKGKT